MLNAVKQEAAYLFHRIREQVEEKEKHIFVFSNEHHRFPLCLSFLMKARQVFSKKNADETEADYLDRKTRFAARWYQNHLKGKAKVLLLTNDQYKKQAAAKEGVNVQTSKP